MSDLRTLYDLRFAATGLAKRHAVWRVLCKHFFSKLVPANSTILDVACGYGEFINNIRARKKYAIDLNEDSPSHLDPDVNFYHTSATDLSALPRDEIDVAFTSNFLEHFHSKDELDLFLRELHMLLKPGGRFIIMGPNIRYAYREYWDYYDHHLPLSHLSLVEALALAGFEAEKVIDRFLPYTMKNGAPTGSFVIRAYLKLSPAWRLFGKQFLVVARKPA
ncbi:MAG: Ubiquinone/menaquinone biosynthesis C-methyltransferase UbiE [Alphaproteobacteria bacterium]|jgi:SAM-dependent methyltransferase|nr:Ubiquinone/menaquinone biosynthesis C-methyltransferase UbiE [Alphaproteobacteria bacterium]